MRILVVEDEAFIAVDLAWQLTEAGFEVVGPAAGTAEALALIDRPGCDAAILDVNLRHESSEVVAIELTRRSVPFITLSGYSSDQHAPAFKDAPFLMKPVRYNLLAAELQRLKVFPSSDQRH